MTDCLEDPILVFDVGGSHVAASLFHPASTTLGLLHDLPLPPDANLETFMTSLATLAENASPGAASHRGVAVAMPNPFDYARGISFMQHKYQSLYGIDLRPGLAVHLTCDPSTIHFLNDAAAFLIGEIHQGAARAVSRTVGITLGTGVGSAFAIDGQIVTDGRGVPPDAEIWNLPYRQSIVEDSVSTRAIQRLYQDQGGPPTEVWEIARLAAMDSRARLAFESFGEELGKVLRSVCSGFEPQRIVLGGGISRSAALFLPAAESELAGLAIELRVSQLFNRAQLIGAGVDWKQKFPRC